MSVIHPIPPVFDGRSRVLILGSFPSVKSREEGFFYGHPRNRFWRVIAGIFGEDAPVSVEEKKAFLLSHGIALWDVIASCEVDGSADSSIRSAVANDIGMILSQAEIAAIFTNGTTAHRLYGKLILPSAGIKDVPLPSTSPANARMSEAELIEKWTCIRNI